MELRVKPTDIKTLRTFQDKHGNEYELRGQQNMQKEYLKTNYYELYYKDPKSKDFVKVGAKEELYSDIFGNGYRPLALKKERYNKKTGELKEVYEITKKLNGYDIECKNKSLSMNEPVRVLITEDCSNPIKVKLPSYSSIIGYKKFTNMTKRILKLFSHV